MNSGQIRGIPRRGRGAVRWKPAERSGDCGGHPDGPILSLQLAFPCDDDPPAPGFKLAGNPAVPDHVPLELVFPEGNVGLWIGCDLATLVPVPEASMDEDCRLVTGKDDIWLTRQACMETEAKAKRMKRPSQGQFGRRVARPDPGHAPGPLRGGKEIRHLVTSSGAGGLQGRMPTQFRVDSISSRVLVFRGGSIALF
jgi:hypothetical protein